MIPIASEDFVFLKLHTGEKEAISAFTVK